MTELQCKILKYSLNPTDGDYLEAKQKEINEVLCGLNVDFIKMVQQNAGDVVTLFIFYRPQKPPDEVVEERAS